MSVLINIHFTSSNFATQKKNMLEAARLQILGKKWNRVVVNNTCYLANLFQFVKYGLSKSHFRHVFTVQHCLHYKEQSSGTLIIFKIATSVLTFHNIMNCSQNRLGTKVFVKSFIFKNERKHNCTGITIKQQWVNFYQAETKPLMLIRVTMHGQSHLGTHKN